MNEEQYDIGILDSGMGGLTVTHFLFNSRPDLNILYYADTCNAPYGLKTNDEIVSFTTVAVEELISHGVETILIACNTAAIYFTDKHRDKYPNITFIDVLQPLLSQLEDINKNELLYLLCTKATARSNYFQTRLQAMGVNYEIIVPNGIVRLIESGQRDLIRRHIADILPTKKILTSQNSCHLAYACTHYPLVKDIIESCWTNLENQYDAISATAEILNGILPVNRSSGKLDIIIHEINNEPYHDEILQFIPEFIAQNIFYIEPVN